MKNSRFLVTAIFAVVSFFGFSQGDEPSNAQVLTVGLSCNFVAGTTAGATSSAGIPAPGCANYDGRDVWYRFVVPANGTVTVNTDEGTIDDSGMAWYRGSVGSLTLFDCDDNDSPNGAMSRIIANCLTPGETVFVRVWRRGSTSPGTFSICASTVIGNTPTNSTCSNMKPICSGSPISFPALAGGSSARACDPGNNYACLATTPNPSWYYLEIANPGNLAINMSALSDIDFAFWGPFANLTAAKANCGNLGAPIDCSYSTSPIEQANATAATTGQVYVLLVTNYANTPQVINVVTSPGSTATTNCAIVPLPVELTQFSVAQMGTGAQLSWITESETNSDYFIVERSVTGNVWQAIGSVKAKGQSNSILNYSFADKTDLSGTVYYRLKMIDKDGASRLSEIETIQLASNLAAIVYPMPVNKEFRVKWGKGQFQSVNLLDVAGKPLSFVSEFESDEVLKLNLETVKNGVYVLQIVTSEGVIQQPFVVQQ